MKLHKPQIGDIYKLKSDDPFCDTIAKIIDIRTNAKKEVWVKYNHYPFSIMFFNNTMELNKFNSLYTYEESRHTD